MICLPADDSYDTVAAPSRLPAWLRQSRPYFVARMFLNYYGLGRCGRLGRLTSERQAYYAECNLRVLEHCGATIHIRGMNNIRAAEGPFVIVGNHMSTLETALLNAMLSHRIDLTYVIKNSLFKTPCIGPAMAAINAIGVDRTSPRDDFKVIIEAGKQRLAAGCSVLIFPEATRQREFQPQRFNSIGTKLARAAGVKILPFAVKTDFLAPGGRLFPELGPLRPQNQLWFEFGQPLSVDDNEKEVHRQIVDFIQDRLTTWKQLDRP